MTRKFKFHEQKLLKKVDFLDYKDNSLRENQVIKRYHLQDKNDYLKYNRLCGMVKKVAHQISLLLPNDPYRIAKEDQLLDKLYRLGIIKAKLEFSQCEKIGVSNFCRRRLAVVVQKLKMAETVSMAVKYIEQGHVRVGPQTISDPAFLVTRVMEDAVTWVDGSKIKRKVLEYHDKLDDYDLL